jgi:hypothetical protein
MISLHPDDLRTLQRIIDKVDGINGPGVTNTPTAISINRPHPRKAPAPDRRQKFFFARIIGGNDAAGYTWIEQHQSKLGFEDNDEPRTESSPGAQVALPMNAGAINKTVVMFECYDPEEDPPFFYRFLHLPSGQYRHQKYQMVAQNEPGWDFFLFHPQPI